MQAISKSGKIFSERFAKTAIRIGIAKQVTDEKPKAEKVKSKGRPKAEKVKK